eukprot:g3147.t1
MNSWFASGKFWLSCDIVFTPVSKTLHTCTQPAMVYDPEVERAKQAEKDRKGQRTAIITGAVSITIGVIYLGMEMALEGRQMLPPPPEALIGMLGL